MTYIGVTSVLVIVRTISGTAYEFPLESIAICAIIISLMARLCSTLTFTVMRLTKPVHRLPVIFLSIIVLYFVVMFLSLLLQGLLDERMNHAFRMVFVMLGFAAAYAMELFLFRTKEPGTARDSKNEP
ncbi:MAG: hypothetical protein JSS83_11515 [Cyanobacteria bacterium SZAS LIN-3]|nr:hypothetical protein [Cyanobacteria bacterium SZAS LIN-3]MBS2011164.1 hypothetical protein [Cyanobacteria bacterium SZAS TMP-1]